MEINTYTFTTALLMIFAVFVVYTRMKNWVESNIPLMFYAVMIAYAHSYADRIPAIPLYIGLALALLLRFEFMAVNITRVVKFFEFCVIGAILYECYVSMTA